MHPFYEREGIRIYVGDNREVLPHIEPVHAVVTDPPYGLSFMGKGWDHQVPGVEFWQAIGEAMLPGAHLLAFGGTRTFHRMAVAIEDAGFDIRDVVSWLYGSGFPKSHDVSKAIDKMAGAEREVTGRTKTPYRVDNAATRGVSLQGSVNGDFSRQRDDDGYRYTELTAPATPAAEQWQGWGTALKPAYEPIIMARLPFKGTVAANVLAHGTGALNIDASRIGTDNTQRTNGKTAIWSDGGMNSEQGGSAAGRWPANVILDEAAAAMLDAQSGERKSGGSINGRPTRFMAGSPEIGERNFEGYGDTGGASRFFYVAKASRRERNAGLDGMPEVERTGQSAWAGVCNVCGSRMMLNGKTTCGHNDMTWVTGKPQQNTHPTVKPIALMRYLIQMVTPPEGIVLDPFMGSGSTLVAAAELGFNAIGIELSEEYAEIAARRVDHMLEERDPQLALEGIA